MSGGFFDQHGSWIAQGPRSLVPLALESAGALLSCMADGTPDKAIVRQLIESRREGRKIPSFGVLPPLGKVAARILDGDGTDDAAEFWRSQAALRGQSSEDMASVRARKDGEPYESLSGYPWQEWIVTMADGSERRASAPVRGPESGARAARHKAEGAGAFRFASDTPYRVQPSR